LIAIAIAIVLDGEHYYCFVNWVALIIKPNLTTKALISWNLTLSYLSDILAKPVSFMRGHFLMLSNRYSSAFLR